MKEKEEIKNEEYIYHEIKNEKINKDSDKISLKKEELFYFDSKFLVKTYGYIALMIVATLVMFLFTRYSDVAWYFKAVTFIPYLFYMLYTYYTVKYGIGTNKRKHPIKIDTENKKMHYYCEYSGDKILDLTTLAKCKVFRNKKRIHLIEMIVDSGEENINVAAINEEEVNKLIKIIKAIKTDALYTENAKPYKELIAERKANQLKKIESLKAKNKK